jgi:DNA modification methylase
MGKVMLVNGNALKIPLADGVVQCVVTSPPYWGLRDYGTATWEGGEKACLHTQERKNGRCSSTISGGQETNSHAQEPYRDICGKCGAVRKDDQLGLEETPEQYVARMVEVFREVWRVLRPDGVLFLNLGDSYNGSGGAGGDYNEGGLKEGQPRYPGRRIGNLKPKDLVGIPWMVAFALRADGWYLRSDIIWAKPNPMPESVTDRPTKSHEYVFLLAKNEKYFYDNEAIREGDQVFIRKASGYKSDEYKLAHIGNRQESGFASKDTVTVGRNRRTVWTIPTAPYSGAHFATYPPALVEPCIKAGTSERGCCAKCGKPWERVTEKGEFIPMRWKPGDDKTQQAQRLASGDKRNEPSATSAMVRGGVNERITLGWQPTCACPPSDPVPCIVLDPFAGSGTTLLVARALGRHAVGLDLSYNYLHDQARERLGLGQLERWIGGESKRNEKNGKVEDFSDLALFRE